MSDVTDTLISVVTGTDDEDEPHSRQRYIAESSTAAAKADAEHRDDRYDDDERLTEVVVTSNLELHNNGEYTMSLRARSIYIHVHTTVIIVIIIILTFYAIYDCRVYFTKRVVPDLYRKCIF